MLPFVRVVVLNWNGGEYIVRCIEHLTKTDWPDDRLEIVMLDNASSDGSDQVVAERFPRVRVWPTGANLGFVANNLAMRELDGIDYLALVNNDAFVEPDWLRPLADALDRDPGLGAACPRILFAPAFHEVRVESPTFQPPGDGRHLGVRVREIATPERSLFAMSQFVKGAWGLEPDDGGPDFRWLGGEAVIRVGIEDHDEATRFGFFDLELKAEREKEVVLSCGLYRARVTIGPEWRRVRVPHWQRSFDVVNNVGGVFVVDGFGADRGFLQVDGGQFEDSVEVFNWCGGGVLLRRQFLEHVGLFDERFFLYYEDTDLSWRGQALGWRYRYVPESVLRHLHAASSGESSDTFQFFVERNRLYLLTKNAPLELAVRSIIGSATATASYAVRDVLPPLRRLRRPPIRHVFNRSRSFFAFAKRLPDMWRSRRALEARRTVSHEDLATKFTPRVEWSEDEFTIGSLAGFSVEAEPWRSDDHRTPAAGQRSGEPGRIRETSPT